MAKNFENDYRQKIIGYATEHGMLGFLPDIRLFVLKVKRIEEVTPPADDQKPFFNELVRMIAHAYDRGYLTIVGPNAGPPFVPAPDLKDTHDQFLVLTNRIKELNGKNAALSADKKSLLDDLNKTKGEYDDLQNEKKNLLDEKKGLNNKNLRIRRIATLSFTLILMLCLALGLYASSLFSDLEESFNERLAAAEFLASDAEDRAARAESRSIIAERLANQEKSRADDAEARARIAESQAARAEDSLSDAKETIADLQSQIAELQTQLESKKNPSYNSGSSSGSTGTSSAPSSGTPSSDVSNTLSGTSASDRLQQAIEEQKKKNEELKKLLEGLEKGTTPDNTDNPPPTPPQEPEPIDPIPPTSYTVYITESGTKYHASGCQYLSKSKIPIDKEKAVSGGYKPCSKCWS